MSFFITPPSSELRMVASMLIVWVLDKRAWLTCAGLDFFTIMNYCFDYRSINKGVHALVHTFGMNLNIKLIAFGHGQIYSIICFFDISVDTCLLFGTNFFTHIISRVNSLDAPFGYLEAVLLAPNRRTL